MAASWRKNAEVGRSLGKPALLLNRFDEAETPRPSANSLVVSSPWRPMGEESMETDGQLLPEIARDAAGSCPQRD
ncbi:hypothetical protein ACOJBO_32660 [Rhizobium beringeri]